MEAQEEPVQDVTKKGAKLLESGPVANVCKRLESSVQSSTCFEFSNFLGSDLDLLAGSRVNTFVSSVLLNSERTKTDQLYGLALSKSFSDSTKNCSNCISSSNFRHTGLCSNGSNEFRLVHNTKFN